MAPKEISMMVCVLRKHGGCKLTALYDLHHLNKLSFSILINKTFYYTNKRLTERLKLRENLGL